MGPRAGQVNLGVTDGVYGPEDFSGVVVRRADGAVGLSAARSYSTGTACYNIVSETDLRDAAERLAAYLSRARG